MIGGCGGGAGGSGCGIGGRTIGFEETKAEALKAEYNASREGIVQPDDVNFQRDAWRAILIRY